LVRLNVWSVTKNIKSVVLTKMVSPTHDNNAINFSLRDIFFLWAVEELQYSFELFCANGFKIKIEEVVKDWQVRGFQLSPAP
jgi:hypothetical protein